MDLDKARRDLEASLGIIRANAELVSRGNQHCYRVIATELRKLLCDGKNDSNSLIPRVIPDFRLHPLLSFLRPTGIVNDRNQVLMPAGCVVFYMPGVLSFDGKGGSKPDVIFDELAETIALTDWLAQPLFRGDVTIRQLIKSISEKESAHSDPEYDDTLKFTRRYHLPGAEIDTKYIVWIGEYVAKMVQKNSPVSSAD